MKEAGIEEYTVLDKTFKGAELENIWLQHPMLDKKSRVILGSDNDLLVTLDAGTGLVHTAPGHGHEDYLACKRYGDIEIICPVDEKGYMTAEAGEFNGMLYSDANDKIIEKLDEVGALVTSKKIEHPYPHCWRCHKPIIYRATTQWFASVDKFRDAALSEIKNVNWYPKWGEDRMYNMLKDRADWCISRQRTWGVPIPIFYCKDCGKELINDETITRLNELFKQKGTNAWYGNMYRVKNTCD
jgi:isoleucyl-tRNA synthetase